MRLIVCPLHELNAAADLHRPSHVLTLLAPNAEIPSLPTVAQDRRMRLLFHDIAEPLPGFIPPDKAMIARLLVFGAAWDRRAPMIVHCWAGVSRSPAAAYIIACQRSAPGEEQALAQALRQAAPHATPNALMVALADAQLGRDGRMVSAIAGIGRGAECSLGQTFELPLA